MYEEDRDALAAEYVLGTLAADERDQAEALLAIDPGFAEIVRLWERRLGELNVMVEAVEPPPEVWDKIQADIVDDATGGTIPNEVEAELPAFDQPAPQTAPEMPETIEAGAPESTPEPAVEPPITLEPAFQLVPDLRPEAPEDRDEAIPRDLDEPAHSAEELPPAGGAVSDPLTAQAEAVPEQDPLLPHEELSPVAEFTAEDLLPLDALLPPEQPAPPTAERSADVIALRRGVSRWRAMTIAMGAIAALLAVFVAVTQFAPGLVPLGRQPQLVVAAHPQPPATRLTAVLQQDPTAPAFLLTVDPQNRTFTVRTVAATPEAGRSYELWLIPGKSPSPHSLGLIGGEQFTTRPLPANFDVATLRGADYAVSLEPAGGSPSGAPTGPILFKGKMVESVPGSPT